MSNTCGASVWAHGSLLININTALRHEGTSSLIIAHSRKIGFACVVEQPGWRGDKLWGDRPRGSPGLV